MKLCSLKLILTKEVQPENVSVKSYEVDKLSKDKLIYFKFLQFLKVLCILNIFVDFLYIEKFETLTLIKDPRFKNILFILISFFVFIFINIKIKIF